MDYNAQLDYYSLHLFRIYRTNERHLDTPALSVLIFLDFDPDRNLVEDRDGDRDGRVGLRY